MHILMAVVAALGIPADEIVLNRTSLQKIREENRRNQFDEAKSDLIDKVISLFLNSHYFVYVVSLLLPIYNS